MSHDEKQTNCKRMHDKENHVQNKKQKLVKNEKQYEAKSKKAVPSSINWDMNMKQKEASKVHATEKLTETQNIEKGNFQNVVVLATANIKIQTSSNVSAICRSIADTGATL